MTVRFKEDALKGDPDTDETNNFDQLYNNTYYHVSSSCMLVETH